MFAWTAWIQHNRLKAKGAAYLFGCLCAAYRWRGQGASWGPIFAGCVVGGLGAYLLIAVIMDPIMRYVKNKLGLGE